MHSRRSRRVKIIATLGPASADREALASLFQAGADVFRINMSHASHDDMRARVAMIRALEEEQAGRSASWSTCRGRSCGLACSPTARPNCARATPSARRQSDAGRRDARPAAASGDPRVRLHPGHRAPDRRRQGDARVVEEASPNARRHRGRGRAAGCPTARASACRTDHPDLGHDRRRIAPTSTAALEEDIDWIALSFVQRPEDMVEVKEIASGRAAGHGQDREAAGRRPARRDHRSRRRLHGRARRPRGRDAARAGAGHAEAHDAAWRAGSASRWWWRPRCWNR